MNVARQVQLRNECCSQVLIDHVVAAAASLHAHSPARYIVAASINEPRGPTCTMRSTWGGALNLTTTCTTRTTRRQQRSTKGVGRRPNLAVERVARAGNRRSGEMGPSLPE